MCFKVTNNAAAKIQVTYTQWDVREVHPDELKDTWTELVLPSGVSAVTHPPNLETKERRYRITIGPGDTMTIFNAAMMEPHPDAVFEAVPDRYPETAAAIAAEFPPDGLIEE